MQAVNHDVKHLARTSEVLQGMLTDGLKNAILGQRLRSLAGQQLTAVRRRRQTRGVMNIRTPVGSSLDPRSPGVSRHPDANRMTAGPVMRGQSTLRVDRGMDSRRRIIEGDEERVTLSIDLHAAVFGPNRAQEAMMLGQHSAICLAQRLEQPRRALDI